MKRIHIKLILLIIGILIFTAGMVNVISKATHGSSEFKSMMNDIMIPFYSFVIISIIPLSIASLMHSKDIRETRKDLSSFFKGLALFWIIGGAVSVVALIIIKILFVK